MRKKTIEDYAELIYQLQQQKKPVKTSTIANALHIAPSSVTEIFQKLQQLGYVDYQPYKGVTLTAKGRLIARSTAQKHETLKDFFMILGITEAVADEDACKIEHVVNTETMDRLTKFVDFVQQTKVNPLWLDHFDHFYTTGEYIECTPQTRNQCPVHGKKKQNTSTST